jgi:hypothetical protein
MFVIKICHKPTRLADFLFRSRLSSMLESERKMSILLPVQNKVARMNPHVPLWLHLAIILSLYVETFENLP